MEAIGLFFSKFSEELLSAQIALLSFSLALAIYWMLVRKKKRETAEWVPAALVRAYLDRMRADERDTRIKLFGEDHSYAPAAGMPLTQMLGAAPTQMVVSNDPNLVKEIEALRSQLAMADSRAMEFDRTMNGLRAEKSSLEQKIKDVQSAAPAGAGATGPDPKMVKELEELRAKLQEYEVIEDDLANLKKFQKENEQLKQKLSQLESGAPALSVVQGGAAAPAASTTINNTTQKIDTPVTVIPASKPAEAAPAPAPAPVAAAPAPAPAPSAEANTNVLAPVNTSIDAAPAADKSPKQKEEELLSEFEKMLAS